MKLTESILAILEAKLDPSKVQAHKDSIKYATQRLGQARLKLADLKKNKADNLKLLDAKQNVEFWMERVDSLTRRVHESLGLTESVNYLAIADYLANVIEDDQNPERSLVDTYGLNKGQANTLIDKWYELSAPMRMKMSMDSKVLEKFVRDNVAINKISVVRYLEVSTSLEGISQVIEVIGNKDLQKKIDKAIEVIDSLYPKYSVTKAEYDKAMKQADLEGLFKEIQLAFKSYEDENRVIKSGRRTIDLKSVLKEFITVAQKAKSEAK